MAIGILVAVCASELLGIVVADRTIGVSRQSRTVAIVVFAICFIRMFQGARMARWALSLSLFGFGIAKARLVLAFEHAWTTAELVPAVQSFVRITCSALLQLRSVAGYVEYRHREMD